MYCLLNEILTFIQCRYSQVVGLSCSLVWLAVALAASDLSLWHLPHENSSASQSREERARAQERERNTQSLHLLLVLIRSTTAAAAARIHATLFPPFKDRLQQLFKTPDPFSLWRSFLPENKPKKNTQSATGGRRGRPDALDLCSSPSLQASQSTTTRTSVLDCSSSIDRCISDRSERPEKATARVCIISSAPHCNWQFAIVDPHTDSHHRSS